MTQTRNTPTTNALTATNSRQKNPEAECMQQELAADLEAADEIDEAAADTVEEEAATAVETDVVAAADTGQDTKNRILP